MAAAAITEATLLRLRQLEEARRQLQQLDEAVALLSPADKLIYHKLILHPERGNAALLCQLLELEIATIYRRRTRLLQQLSSHLPPPP